MLTTEQVAELHGKWYDGATVTETDATAVIEWFDSIKHSSETPDSEVPGIGEIILSVYVLKYVSPFLPSE